jgi:Flp pilus assembly protein TadG
MRARLERGPGRERGAVAVEFALVATLLFTVLLGILQYGYHYWALETASATAREAARKYAVGTEQACTQAKAKEHAGTAALGPVTVSPRPSGMKVGDVITVTISFQSLDMHLFPLPNGGVVTQSEKARVESVPDSPRPC